MKDKPIQFLSDKVKIKIGHRVDGSAEVTFEVGEYMVEKILPIALLSDSILKVTIEKE